MFQTGKWAAAVALVGASVWAGVALTAQEPKPAPSARPADLTALREAVTAAAKRGDNVDEIRRALTALEKALSSAKAGEVPVELRALRDAVEAAAKKGENVDAVQKELAAVETAIAGRSFAPPKPVPEPPAAPKPLAPRFPNPPAFPVMPVVPENFEPLLPGRVDPEAFQKANELRMKALDLLLKNPNDPEARKLTAEANDLMLKSLLPNLKNLDGFNGAGGLMLPDFGPVPDRVPERARLGIRFEALSPVIAEQLGLDADVGVAVAAVLPGSAAERAGLKVHDIVLEFAGKPVSGNADAFVRQVNAAKTGEKLSIVVMRKGKKVEIKGVVLPDLNNPEVAPRALGLPVNPNNLPNLPRENRKPAQPQRAKPVPLPPLSNPLPPIPEKSENTNIRAEAEPEPVKADLTDLRDAVTIAAKRGDNVDDIRKALTALEKALTNSAAKKGEAPPQLVALREVVEAAAKKGENVDRISKELGTVEKALTGREYERPKLEEPNTEQPEFPRRGGGFNQGGFGRGVVNPGGFGGNPGGFGGRERPALGGIGGFNATSVAISNGNFVIRARMNDVNYTITGSMDATANAKITIKDGNKSVEAENLKKVPEAYRANVEKLLKLIDR